jgi:hypothetical protein
MPKKQLTGEFQDIALYFHYKTPVRAFLEARNRVASRMLWDGKPDDDVIKFLVKTDFPDKLWKDQQKEMGLKRGHHKRGATSFYISSPRLSGQHKNPETDWHVTKPVRSK